MTARQTIRLLIVEDHASLAKNLAEFFDSDAYALDFADDGLTALHLLATQDYDVIVLDVMLPGVSGFDLCYRLRNELHKSTPVLMMTAKDQLHDKEEGFDSGADDYLVKPFNLRELQLRIEALYRRQYGFSQTQKLNVADLVFDLSTMQVSNQHASQVLTLSGIPAKILQTLMRAYPALLDYDDLVAHVWGDREVDMNTVRTQVYSLRRLLQETWGYTCIKTFHGQGYRLLSAQEAALEVKGGKEAKSAQEEKDGKEAKSDQEDKGGKETNSAHKSTKLSSRERSL